MSSGTLRIMLLALTVFPIESVASADTVIKVPGAMSKGMLKE